VIFVFTLSLMPIAEASTHAGDLWLKRLNAANRIEDLQRARIQTQQLSEAQAICAAQIREHQFPESCFVQLRLERDLKKSSAEETKAKLAQLSAVCENSQFLRTLSTAARKVIEQDSPHCLQFAEGQERLLKYKAGNIF
jgi:hypothetical protein